MARYELTDEQWALLQGLFPKQGRGGRWLDHRTMLNGMLWILRSGAPWRDLPGRYGKWQSVNHRFNRWRRDGTFQRILKALQIRLDKAGRIDWDLWLVDGTNIRASRGGRGSKLHLVTDGNGLILAATLTAGQTHESTQLGRVMHAVRRPCRIGWPKQLGGDKGYSHDPLRRFLHSCGIEPVIPRRSNQPHPEGERFDRRTYRKRCRIEQAVGWLKECRRLGTRYDKLGLNFLAFVKLGIMLRYLRILDPSDTA